MRADTPAPSWIVRASRVVSLREARDAYSLRLKLLPATLVLAALGLLRTVLEVALGVVMAPKWYVLDADVLFTMAFFVPHFCFFGGALVHVVADKLGRKIPLEEVLSFVFCLQVAHLSVAFVDAAGLRLGLPWYFELPGMKPHRGPYFTSLSVMTPGIVAVWSVCGAFTLAALIRRFQLGVQRSLAVSLITFNVLYWPIYHVWPTFNTVSDFLIHGTRPTGVLPDRDFTGYGFYFLFTTLAGIAYAVVVRRRAALSESPR